MKKIKLRFVIWDWKAAPESGDLEKALAQVYNRKNLPKMTYVPNPGWDQYTLIVSSEKISEDDAQRIFDLYLNQENDIYKDVFKYDLDKY